MESIHWHHPLSPRRAAHPGLCFAVDQQASDAASHRHAEDAIESIAHDMFSSGSRSATPLSSPVTFDTGADRRLCVAVSRRLCPFAVEAIVRERDAIQRVQLTASQRPLAIGKS
jgi:hypothetical protein